VFETRHAMNMSRRKRGAMLIDAILAIYLVAIAALVLSATLGGAIVSRGLADQRTKATCVANRQIEAIKSLGYPNLNFASLQFYGLADASTSATTCTFTTCGTTWDRVSTILPQGTGTITITDVTTTVKKVVVTVTWLSRTGNRTVSVSTEIGRLT
jgi:type II secretory pathway pseudopilin PulG